MKNETRFLRLAFLLLGLSFIGFFIGLSDANVGLFDFDLGLYFFGDFDNEFDVLAWLLLLSSFPAFIFNIVVIYNTDLLLKKSNLGSETLLNLFLIFVVPFYQLYYIYKRLDYLAKMDHPIGDKKFLYPMLAFIGLNTFAFALTHDEIISSAKYRNSFDSVFTTQNVTQGSYGNFEGSVADELVSLKRLLDDDAISKDEYDKMKDKLLSK